MYPPQCEVKRRGCAAESPPRGTQRPGGRWRPADHPPRRPDRALFDAGRPQPQARQHNMAGYLNRRVMPLLCVTCDAPDPRPVTTHIGGYARGCHQAPTTLRYHNCGYSPEVPQHRASVPRRPGTRRDLPKELTGTRTHSLRRTSSRCPVSLIVRHGVVVSCGWATKEVARMLGHQRTWRPPRPVQRPRLDAIRPRILRITRHHRPRCSKPLTLAE